MPTSKSNPSKTSSRGTGAARARGAASRASGTSTRGKSAAARSTTSRSTTGRATSARRSTQPQILALLKTDHDKVKKMFRQFERMVETAPQDAAGLSQEIIRELELHTKLEEDIVYPSLQQQDEDLFHEAHEEHHVADLLIKEIQGLQAGDPTFKAKMTVLRENVEHHIEEEEGDMFKEIRKIDKARLTRMAEQWTARKEGGIPASMMR
ncbi:MAG: hemerythrin domain-containing protein [Dehalococcoidia bacterium]